ncbi:hypothetical protein HY3_04475 [Hyphomonas pacifica]|uniref:Uncharacterized protein n=2 Tax=Hyphomonas pacifica TaxID=1280941 RepID=A0A062TUB2_9PROT|nr:hypothetical protein HY2_04775 [Hyphomonas pacifica]RAN31350.1 hypothetical protein HY3_04475 [Hyphomonas pacifica]
MDAMGDFLVQGLEQARRAVVDVVGRDNLQLNPKTMPRSRRARANGRLKQIETIVRRLILLMAFALKLGPLAASAPRAPQAEPDLPEGTQLAIFPRVPVKRFTLMPPARRVILSDQARDTFGAVLGLSGPVSTQPLIDRILALQKILKAPEAAAKRLARTLQRMQAKGEARPMVGPAAGAFRLSPELGAVATALPGFIRAGLESWESSG